MRNWLDIVDVLFRYMGMLDKKGPQEWIFQEIRDVANIQYRRETGNARRGGVCVKRYCRAWWRVAYGHLLLCCCHRVGYCVCCLEHVARVELL